MRRPRRGHRVPGTPFFHFAYWEPSLIQYNPPVPRIGFGIAAFIMSAVTFGLMVVLPSGLEQQSFTLAVQAEPHRTAAKPPASDMLDLPCTVAIAVNTSLFAGAPATAVDPQCKQPS